KRQAKRLSRVAAAKTLTFAAAAETYITAHEPRWRDPRAAPQWRASLRDHANPVIGALSVDEIDTAAVMRCLSPIWTTRTEIASAKSSAGQKPGPAGCAHEGARSHRDRQFYGRAANAKWRRRSRARVRDLDGLPPRRGDRRPVERDRPGREGLDDPCREDEGR